MKFFDRGSDIVVSTERIEESVSKREFQAAVEGDNIKIFGQAGGEQIYLFADVLEPIEPDVATLVDTLNTWALISLRQKMTTEERLAIPNPTTGIEIYDTTLNIPMYFDGTQWQSMSAGNIEGAIFFNSPITPPPLTTASVDNFDPDGLKDSNMMRISSTNGPGTQINGLKAPPASPTVKNQIILIINIGTKKITLMDSVVSSDPENRFELGSNITINQNESAAIVYDRDISRYIVWALNN